MRLTNSLGLTMAALAFSAPMALAEGCAKWGHSAMLSAEAEATETAPAMTVMPEETVVAMLGCEGMSGDALAACEAGKTTTAE